MRAIHLPLLFVGKASHESTQYSIYITTEKALIVRYDSYLPKMLQLNPNKAVLFEGSFFWGGLTE